MSERIAILGGGLGGLRTAQALRDRGFGGELEILSEEEVLPYDRPPLSKAFLRGETDEDALLLTGAEQLAERGISVRLGARGVGLDLAARRVTLDDGEQVAYERLVIATGARPNRIAMFDGLEDVVYLRDVADARRLRDALRVHPRLGVVGGGFIGLEIASVARALGCEVTVIEAATAPLAPVLGAELGGWVQAWHEEQGVHFECGSPLAQVEGDRRSRRLRTADGRLIEVDLVVVGTGIARDVRWLRDAGLKTHRGLVCDANGHTSDRHVFGVGDVTCCHDGSECVATGHWTATGEQARAAAAELMGGDERSAPVQEGYFWSDQYDRRLQFAGTVTASPTVHLSSGTPAKRKYVALLGDGESVTGVFAMSSPREFALTTRSLRAAVDTVADRQ